MNQTSSFKIFKIISSSNITGYLIALVLLLAIIGPHLLREGMFMDGTIYAVLSRNLAEGIGSFWYLEFTRDPLVVFHEHPPLVMGLQSLLFKICPNCFYAERLYSLIIFIGIAVLMIKIWQIISPTKNLNWLPVLFLFLLPKIAWSVSANMLENTMGLFLLFGFYCYLKFDLNKSWLWIILMGMATYAGFLSKGFVALFVWSIPFWFFIFSDPRKFWSMFGQSFLLIITTILSYVLTVLIWPEAFDSILNKYMTIQVLDSLANDQTVGHRFQVVNWFLTEAFIALSITLLLALVLRLKWKEMFYVNRISFMLICISLSGILPIMISMKQYSHYITPALFFLALGLALLGKNVWQSLSEKWQDQSKWINYICIGILVMEMCALWIYRDKPYRDEEAIHLVKEFEKLEGAGKVIGMHPDVAEDYGLEAYFNRYSRTSFAPNDSTRFYYISKTLIPNSHELLIRAAGYSISKSASQ